MRDQIYIIGGGTFSYLRGHCAMAAVAFGTTAIDLINIITYDSDFEGEVHLYTTRMADDLFFASKLTRVGKPFGDGPTVEAVSFEDGDPRADEDYAPKLVTNDDVLKLAMDIVKNPRAKILFLPAALCDFNASILSGEDVFSRHETPSGRTEPRLSSSTEHIAVLKPAPKVIRRIREERKDLYLVGFKETHNLTEDEMFEAGLRLLKQSSCNLVLVNDVATFTNMVVTPEQSRYAVGKDRGKALGTLVDMAISRSNGHFTRSSVVQDSKTTPWDSPDIPQNLRTVVEHCIKRGAYRPFMGKTVGHFAARLRSDDPTYGNKYCSWNNPGAVGALFLTSLRKTNFNEIDQTGMAKAMIMPDDRISVLGGKPSVGGVSQKIIFTEHPDVDCIVHFHCPMKEGVNFIPVAEQWKHECGSHECGKNTSDNLHGFNLPDGGMVKAVMLEKHGPNIVFSRDTDPQKVIDFIEKHFDLSRQTSELS